MIRRWGFLVICWSVILAAAAYQFFQMSGSASEAPEPPKHKVVLQFSTPWQDESQFIVTSICSDLAEMAYFANHGQCLGSDFQVQTEEKQFSPDHPVYQVTARFPDGSQLSQTLSIRSSIWDPEGYQEWCRGLQPRRVQADPLKSEAVISQLTDPRPAVLARLDRELSQAGAKSMGDPNWHDQAALLLVSLALREPSGTFFEIRRELSRSCAHLAMSDSLRGKQPPSTCHQLARAALACLYRREDLATPLLKPLSDQGPVGAWKRALTIRRTLDYRLPIQGSLLEERERFLAEFSVGSCAGGWKHRSKKPEWRQLADWTRVAGSVLPWTNDAPGVEIGHQLLAAGLPAELAEARQVWLAEGWGKAQVSDLNTPAQRCLSGASVQVIGKGLWASFLQRQLCHIAVCDWLFLQEGLGDGEGAREYAQKFQSQFSKLRLYPFALCRMAGDEASYHQALDQAGALIRSAPESVPAYAWNWLFYGEKWRYRPPTIRVLNEWHHQNPLPGTAYDLQPRMNHPSFFNRPDFLDKLTQLQAASPHDPVLYSYLLAKKEVDPESALKILEPSRDYNADAAIRTSEQSMDSQESKQWLERAVALNPRYLLRAMRAEQDDSAAYAQYFEKWLQTSPDAVAVANQSHAMIRYYESHGRRDKAAALADQAAETGSFLGLCAKADLLESKGQFDQALTFYGRVEERYHQFGPLLGCLMRVATKNPRYQDRLQQALDRLPAGLQAYQGSAAAPERGVLVTSDVEDLKKGDIIVAVRGYQVQSQGDYVAIRDTQPFADFRLIIYRDKRYSEMGPYPGHHAFGNLVDYQR